MAQQAVAQGVAGKATKAGVAIRDATLDLVTRVRESIEKAGMPLSAEERAKNYEMRLKALHAPTSPYENATAWEIISGVLTGKVIIYNWRARPEDKVPYHIAVVIDTGKVGIYAAVITGVTAYLNQ